MTSMLSLRQLVALGAHVNKGRTTQARQSDTKEDGFSNLARYTELFRTGLRLLAWIVANPSRHQHLLKTSVMSHQIHGLFRLSGTNSSRCAQKMRLLSSQYN